MLRKRLRTYWYDYRVNPWNIPQARPGVYLIQHVESGLCYIGASRNVAKRLQRHKLRGEKAHAAPLYYSLTKTADELPEVEAALTETYDSIKRGYNKVRRFSRAPWTPEVTQQRVATQRALRTPEAEAERLTKFMTTIQGREYKRRRQVAYSAQDRTVINAKISTATRATKSTPEFKQRHSIAMIEVHSRSEVKAKHRAATAAANARPEVKAKIAASKIGRVWINNGIEIRCVFPIDIPIGWRRGKRLT